MKVLRVVDSVFGRESNPNMPRLLVPTELGEQLSDSNMTVFTVELPPPARHRHLPVANVALPRRIFGRAASSFRLLRREVRIFGKLIKLRREADVLLVEQGLSLRLALLRAIATSGPKIAAICYDPFPWTDLNHRGRVLQTAESWFRRFLFSRLDIMFVVSREQASSLQASFGVHPKIAFVPMAIDHSLFHRDKCPEDNTLLIVDGIHRDFTVLARAIEILQTKPIRVIVVHRLNLDRTKEAAIAKMEQNGAYVEVHHRATGSQLKELYERASIVVVPTIPSSQPAGLTAMLEAMAMECTLICTKSQWTDEYVVPDINALMFESRRADVLAKHLDYVLSDPAKGRDMARAGGDVAKQLTFEQSREQVRLALGQTGHASALNKGERV